MEGRARRGACPLAGGLVGGYRSWRCSVCGEPVVEGQRFLWLPGGRVVHLECVQGLLAERRGEVPRGLVALLDAVEAVSYAIVRLKGAERLAAGTGEEDVLREQRKRLEGAAALLEKRLEEALREAGVELGASEA